MDIQHIEAQKPYQNSFRNRIWRISSDGNLTLREQVIQARGIVDLEDFCNPTIRRLMPNPAGLHDIDLLADAVIAAKKIGIFGDYDVDGLTSVAMWSKFLADRSIAHSIYVPNRSDGYGASRAGIEFLLNQDVDLLLFLDCGSNSAQLLTDLPVPVCIVDHHQVTDSPQVVALVNPHYPANGQESYTSMCTAGLSFMTIARLARLLDSKICMSLLDLVAIGTIGDVMPVTGFNKACIKRGLELINSGQNTGIQQLIIELSLNYPITATDLNFYVIPCLNAAGRISDANLAFRLLTSNDTSECTFLARTLKSLNSQRRDMEDIVMKQAISRVDPTDPIICLRSEEWHPGLVGIIAGRVKEIYNKSAFVLYKTEGFWKGSARGVNVGKLIIDSVEAGLAAQGGGHSAAGGVTIHESRITEWEEWIKSNKTDADDVMPEVKLDGSIPEHRIGEVAQLKDLGPFGQANPQPKIRLEGVWLREVFVRNSNVRCTLHSGRTLVGFKFGEEMLHRLRNSTGKVVDILLSIDESGKFKMDDAMLHVTQ